MVENAKLINGKVQIIDIAKPILNSPGAIIRVLGCGLCGSDLVKIKHATKENEENIILGHEVVGVIEQINCKVKNHTEGVRILFTTKGTEKERFQYAITESIKQKVVVAIETFLL